MRKIFLFNMITLDGFFEGPNQDISWHNVDDEFNEFAIKQLRTVDTILFGRVTYQLMASYWPTPAALEDDPVVGAALHEPVRPGADGVGVRFLRGRPLRHDPEEQLERERGVGLAEAEDDEGPVHEVALTPFIPTSRSSRSPRASPAGRP